MADWKTQVTYNYKPSYHTYAYSLVYQPGPEQNHGNLNGWGENGVTNLSNYNNGEMQTYYAATTSKNREQSSPRSPELHAVNGHCYQGSGVVYIGDTQAGRLLLAGQHPGGYEATGNEVRRTARDSASDSEAHASPDSWSSGSSREGSLPQADPATWAEKDAEAICQSPDGIDPKKQSTPAVTTPKAKVRAAFSESQMNALVQRFSVQRYLTPAEMKNLAEMTGLTYKQVKTWFQNRRMKLRRHQKDTSWVSERYAVSKDSSGHGSIFSNMAPHIPPYQGEGQPTHYNQHMATFRKNPQKNLAYYLAAMGSNGSAGYSPWSSSSTQVAVPNRSQVAGWSVPPGSHFEYHPSGFNPTTTTNVNNFGHNPGFESKDGENVSSQGSLTPDTVHNGML
ncbi:homeobox protein NANOG isoform X2 [Melanotaenia boesemani]|uniref:homeobox protein NANOG isoform X2 n=1 Tax=Melanotaenia boesemani TaxID=1250792 RepID=UPI001C05D0B3|nr:homeobox protein NANOG isoform X2 [Melanotaenia boesemani]